MTTRSWPLSDQSTAATGSVDDIKGPTDAPPSPARTSDHTASRRHTKGLSLNFPILLPTNASITHSPTANSAGLQSPIESARSSPRTRTAPSASPVTTNEFQQKPRSTTRGSTDFLTLLAGQERKVLELKEELQKAEADLLGLKKQWAAYEANKKRDEVKHVKKLQALALDDVDARDPARSEDEVDEERRRKRALMGRSQTMNPGTGDGNITRKGSKRVFEGGRHTRTLSLLSPTSAHKPGRLAAARPTNETTRTTTDHPPEADSDATEGRLSLSAMPTLDSLVSGDPLMLGFGKTYKDLAAHRRSLPPGAAEALVKQSKQVYDGVREGLWTFFEDIRQATVGEEGINGTAAQQRPPKPPGHPKRVSRRAPNGAKTTSTADRARGGGKGTSFWTEFGLDTPQKPSSTTTPRSRTDRSSGHVQQKSSTDSSNPPSLLPDSQENDDVDDAWDAWESPVSARTVNNVEVAGKLEDGLPWPDIQKDSPSKLGRTVSDLMRDWEGGQNGKPCPPDLSNAHIDGPGQVLGGPHP